MKKLTNSEMDFVISNIRNTTEDYIKTHSIKSLVIGVSGGIDSALVCALMRPVCDKVGIPLIGRSITIESNKVDEIERAAKIGEAFCNDFKDVNLTEQFLTLKSFDELEGGEKELDIAYKIRMGNIKARMRMIYLYNLAGRTKGMVMGTENITEHYLGFCTLHGDSGTDFEPIIGLWKTEVYAIAEYLCGLMTEEAFSLVSSSAVDAKILTPFRQSEALMACILCNATDGLGVSNTDLDQILPDWRERHADTRGGYEEVDDIFVEYFNNYRLGIAVDKIKSSESPVIQRYTRTDFKRNNPFTIKRNIK